YVLGMGVCVRDMLVILDADKKQIQCVVRPLQILRADGTWENIGGMK
ncbi:phage tail fiber C-terminal domain-containing protein, partial [Escherichia coli]